MEFDQEPIISLTNNDFFRHMFIEFLHIQTIAKAPYIKSQYTLDPKVFSGKRFSTEQVHKRLESSGIALDLKITLKLDCMLMPKTRIAYNFLHTSGTTQGYIAPKIQARLYLDWIATLQDLKNVFSDPDPKFFAQRKLIDLW